MSASLATQIAAYAQIADIARTHGLILEAAGGVMTIVHPTVAVEEGVWGQMQRMSGLIAGSEVQP